AVGTFTVDRESLLDTVSRVARSASRDESRPVLTGILVRFEAGKLVMAATDSYRLSVKETELEGEVPELEAIIPARALSELGRIAQTGETIEIGFNEEFLREGIESIGADEIQLRLISPLRPAVIEGGEDDPTYLIMPIRLPG